MAAIYLIVAGAGAGWLAGLSLSPTAGTLITTIAGLGGLVVAGLSGFAIEIELMGHDSGNATGGSLCF